MGKNPDRAGSNPGADYYVTCRHGGDKRPYTRKHDTLWNALEDAHRASAAGRDAEISHVISTPLTASRAASRVWGGRSDEDEGGAW